MAGVSIDLDTFAANLKRHKQFSRGFVLDSAQRSRQAAAPMAVPDSVTVPQGGTCTVNVLANDAGEGLALIGLTQPTTPGVTLTADAQGNVTVTAMAGAALGLALGGYDVADPAGQRASAHLLITVEPARNANPLGKPEQSKLPWWSGVAQTAYGGNPGVLSFVPFRGRGVDLVTLFTNKATWADIITQGNNGDVGRFNAAKRPERPVVGVRLFPDNATDDSPKNKGAAIWQEIAGSTGRGVAILGYWQQMVSSLAATLRPDAILRVGWEMSAQNFPWTITVLDGTPTQIQWYKDSFARLAAMFRTAMPQAKIVWNPLNGGKHVGNITDYYPGNAYVDLVGPDIYDQFNPIFNDTQWASQIAQTYQGGPKGLDQWRLWAASIGRPFCLPEWGCWYEPSNANYGQDNPFFITKMLGYIQANKNDFGYESYFDEGPNAIASKSNMPLASAEYVRLMSGATLTN